MIGTRKFEGAEPTRFLFLQANPGHAPTLRLDEELRAVRGALQDAERSGQFVIDQRSAVRIDDAREALHRFQPHIVHFSGHGTVGGELLMPECDGGMRRVDYAPLAELFALLKGEMRLAVFNACHSSQLARAVAQHIECAIGMRDAMLDEAAIQFTAVFYQAIAFRRTVQEAFDLGRNELRLKYRPCSDIPELALGSGVDPVNVTFPAAASRAPASRPQTPGGGAPCAPPALVSASQRDGGAPRGRAAVQVLLLLDLASDNPIAQEEVEANMPAPYGGRHVYRVTDFGARRGSRGATPDYASCADAVVRMVQAARSRQPAEGPRVQFYVAGRAALPAFAQLGMELSSWADVTLMNLNKRGEWDVLPLAGTIVRDGPPYFQVVKGLDLHEPCESDGRVAVFVSTGHPAPRDAIRTFLAEHREPLARIVELRAGQGDVVQLGRADAAQVMSELVSALERLPSAYPHCMRVALFIAGPAPLAFMAGRAINQNHITSVWVPSYQDGAYRFAASLPWTTPSRPTVSDAADDQLARGAALRAMIERLTTLQRTLRADDLPPLLPPDDATRSLDHLRALNIEREPQRELVSLSLGERRLAFGRELLEALRRAPEDSRPRIGLALSLRELFRLDKDLHATEDGSAGRATAAHEEVEFWADAMAVGTLAAWEMRRGGDEAREKAGDILRSYIDALIDATEALDRFAQGERIAALQERRLRRYLVWYLQRARAATLKRPDEVWRLLGNRLHVDLAPLRASLDEQCEKIVEAPLGNTELVVSVGRRLVHARPVKRDAPELIEAVRRFDRASLDEAMRGIVERYLPILAPWTR